MKRARPAAVRSAAADLHVHTTHSDGSCSPFEVVNAAAAVGLSALAITDHNTLSALAVARPEAARLGVELIARVELTAAHAEREVHILGHFVRDDDPALRFGLIPIAGSDFHAPDRPGRWVGAITTPATDLGRLREKGAARHRMRDGGCRMDD
jgi:hypothetical protein